MHQSARNVVSGFSRTIARMNINIGRFSIALKANAIERHLREEHIMLGLRLIFC